MKPIIEVSHLSKKYKYGESQPYYTLRDTLTSLAKVPFYLLNKDRRPSILRKDEFWALKGVSFDINEGDVVGVIGRNGAGKSTLLKILSQITPPTEGEIKLRGRVASLLEVGTGFHPELTGRENIYLNGAILGMKRWEINNKFNEIVEFAEIEKFLDTPVKHYSSGMYMRLAFAVAAHLEPEILLVDEVLAVGDAQFQKKCLGKMSEISKQGRTVLFVSHNMGAVRQLCKKSILIENGMVAKFGRTENVVNEYSSTEVSNLLRYSWKNSELDYKNKEFKPISLCLLDNQGKQVNQPISRNADIWFCVEGEIEKHDLSLQIGYAIYNSDDALLYWTCQTDDEEKKCPYIKTGYNKLVSKLPNNIFNEGVYRIDLIVALYNRLWILQPGTSSPSIFFNVQGQFSESPMWTTKRPGIIAPLLNWEAK